MDFEHLGELVLNPCKDGGDGTGAVFAFLDPQGKIESSLTGPDLKELVLRMAGIIQGMTRPGDAVILTGLEGRAFISAFFGTVLAGAIPAPIPRPRHPRDTSGFRRLRHIASLTNAALILGEAGTRDLLSAAELGAADLLPQFRTPDELLAMAARPWQPVVVDPGQTAYLQFTSGSTAEPRGIELTHRNVLANLACMRKAFRHTQMPRVVGWIPLHHDMGLSGHVLMPLYLGGFSALMPPSAFLRDPGVWLRAIQNHRGNSCAVPPFALELCLRRRLQDDPALDLSSWTHAYVGSERVPPELLERFAEAFAPRGFRRSALCPAYGLAEASLLVAGGQPEWQAEKLPELYSSIPRASIGYRFDREFVDIRIVASETRENQPDEEAGEIWISGASVSAATQTTQGRLPLQSLLPGSDKPWVPTGDWGMLRGDSLFVLGRTKDLIVIRGAKLAAGDLEQTVMNSHPSLLPGYAAACIPTGAGEAEGFRVVQEIGRQVTLPVQAEIRSAILGALVDQHDAAPAEIRLIPAGTLPRTANGKISRAQCRIRFTAPAPVIENTMPKVKAPSNAGNEDPVVIVGMACRFPGADGPAAFWKVLSEGVDAISEVPPDRWDNAMFYDPRPAIPGKVNTRWGGFITGIDQFDPAFFGISTREATEIDPQQRLLLETTWRLFENTGVKQEDAEKSNTGVFVGISTNDYLYTKIKLTPGMETFDAYTGLGNANSIAANRLSYLFDLRGPSLAVDTACSSSLTAFHLAVESVRRGECSQAIAGGVNAILSPGPSITLSQFGMMAPDGRCKTFDARADGYVRAEGCGLVMLQRRSEALRMGRSILACVRASGVGQDGRSMGITAPNGPSQRDLLSRTLRHSGVDPARVAYVEAHGTGTAAGDPVEVEQIKAVYGMDAAAPPCYVGSVKASIGHLEAAAGIASVIKAVLVLQHKAAPPQLHVQRQNPKIDLAGSRLSIPTRLTALDETAGTYCVAISSFGFGGANSHVLLEGVEPTGRTSPPADKEPQTFQLSGKSREALHLMAGAWIEWLAAHPDANLADICRQQAASRTVFNVQESWEVTSREELQARLRELAPEEAARALAPNLHGPAPLPMFNGRHAVRGQRLDLPGHPFLRQRYWLHNGTAADMTRAAVQAFQQNANTSMVPAPAVSPVADTDWNYELAWAARPFRRQRVSESSATNANWILVGQGRGLGQQLAEHLQTLKQGVFWVATQPPSLPGVRTYSVPEGDGYEESLQHILTLAASEGAANWKVIYLGGLDSEELAATTAASLERDQNLHGPADVTRLVRAITGTGRVLQLWIVTHRAQQVNAPEWSDQGGCPGLSQAPLWGFGRTLFLEHPELRGGLMDFDLTQGGQAEEQLRQQVVNPEGEHAVAFRAEGRYIPQLARVMADWPLVPARTFASQGAYIITGGLGGLGLRCAQWLTQRGARDLVLLGRRTVPARESWDRLDTGSPWQPVIHALRQLEEQGARVETVTLDLRHSEELETLFTNLRQQGRAPRGVLHAAGVNWFSKVRNLDITEFLDTLKIKISAAWKLHELTLQDDLDCFVLFSSVSSLWGSVDLSHYTAANHFLDALAHHRAALQLPATSIAWGPWAEVGMSAKAHESALLNKLGLRLMPPDRALDAMEKRMASKQGLSVIADLDLAKFQTFIDFSLAPSLFERIAGRATAASTALAAGAGNATVTATDNQMLRDLDSIVRRALGSVMMVEGNGPVDQDQRFNLLGMDSLMAIAFAAELERLAGVTLPITIAYNYPTIRSVRDYLHETLGGAASLPGEPLVQSASTMPTPQGASASLMWFHTPPAPEDSAISIARPRLYCFPGAGAGASFYAGWVEQAASWVEVIRVQLPGREELASMEPMLSLSEYVQALADSLPKHEGSFFFHGYSLGALAAFELCRELRRRGQPVPEHLFLSGCGLPDEQKRQTLSKLPDEAFLDALSHRLGTPPSLGEQREFARLLLPVLRADIAMLESFTLGDETPLPCPITVFAGREDPLTPRDRVMLWGTQTTGDFTLRHFAGGHDFAKHQHAALLTAMHDQLA